MLSFFCFFFLFNSRGWEGGFPDFYQIKFHGRNFKKVVCTWSVWVAPNLPPVWQLQLLQLGSAPSSSHPFQSCALPRPRNHFSCSWFQRVSGPTVIFVLHCRHSLLIHNCGLVPATNGRGSVLQQGRGWWPPLVGAQQATSLSSQLPTNWSPLFLPPSIFQVNQLSPLAILTISAKTDSLRPTTIFRGGPRPQGLKIPPGQKVRPT